MTQIESFRPEARGHDGSRQRKELGAIYVGRLVDLGFSRRVRGSGISEDSRMDQTPEAVMSLAGLNRTQIFCIAALYA